jgi:hypothetical protein
MIFYQENIQSLSLGKPLFKVFNNEICLENAKKIECISGTIFKQIRRDSFEAGKEFEIKSNLMNNNPLQEDISSCVDKLKSLKNNPLQDIQINI